MFGSCQGSAVRGSGAAGVPNASLLVPPEELTDPAKSFLCSRVEVLSMMMINMMDTNPILSYPMSSSHFEIILTGRVDVGDDTQVSIGQLLVQVQVHSSPHVCVRFFLSDSLLAHTKECNARAGSNLCCSS